ncbi:ABC transporter permease DevC [Trichocoleus sp. FACHB-262]|uniref:ABC transporter permease DevC n=1 Tax=Trichocoleus sp. FACHB-262 TaxID=2692869 RepID=UPI00168947B5|nr:ABC transporter permease DevC [Trichocoleus sp. FACHB-262]MBD2124658.1 FtsX-like permease family protein [Trichocoleus sp. FACHB-262]
MHRFAKTPLAWLQLTHHKLRLIVALMGIAFAAILIFVQLAFLDSLYESQTAVHKRMKADFVLVDARLRTLSRSYLFPKQYLYRALNFSEVESVNYILYGRQSFKYGNAVGGKGVIVLGINPDRCPFEIPNFQQVAHLLRTRDVVLFDRNSDMKEYDDLVKDLATGKPIAVEVGKERVLISGLVDFAGASFADDGNLITSDTTFFNLLPTLSKNTIAVGLITLKPGVDRTNILNRIENQLPKNVKLMTRQGFIEHEKYYWSSSAPLGFVFTVGVCVSFFVGVIIVYQILYTEITDHLSDYAVLKARGFKHRYFLGVLFQEALILAVLGYIPGFAISLGIYEFVHNATALPMYMTFSRAVLVFLLTMMMCFTSGSISMNKLREADPADLF